MPEPLDQRLCDEQAMAEIELTGRLIIAASDCKQHLGRHEVDELLGLSSFHEAGRDRG